MTRKLILPAEAKVCATCSFWDGERRVDEEVGVIVVKDEAAGECLVRESEMPALLHLDHDCEWEPLTADAGPAAEADVAAHTPPDEGQDKK